MPRKLCLLPTICSSPRGRPESLQVDVPTWLTGTTADFQDQVLAKCDMLRFGKSDLIYDAGDEASVRYSRSIVPKQPFRFREEFRTPLGVRKSARNEPAVCGPRLMGI